MTRKVTAVGWIVGLAAAMLAAAVVAPAPAAASATVNVTLDCASSPSFAASPGDTIVFTFGPGCNYVAGGSSSRMWNLWNANRSFQTNTGSGFLSYVTRSTYTTVDPSAGFSQYEPNAYYASDWYVATPSSGTGTVTTTLLAVDGTGAPLQPGATVANINNEYYPAAISRAFSIVWVGTSMPAAEGPPPSMQAFAIGPNADCGRSAPAWVNWPGLEGQQATGWRRSWQEWPNAGRGGDVCLRQPVRTASGAWSLT